MSGSFTVKTEDGSSNRKRPRLELESDPYVNHPTLYYEDGNVIIRCGNTLFCVHRSIVSKASPALRTLLLPERNPETFRGCMLAVWDDDKDDVEALLATIYDGMRVDFPHITVENFPTLAGLLRMSTKFDLHALRADVITCFHNEWPTSLDAHLAKRRLFLAQYAKNAEAEDLIVHPAAVIALLRESKITDVELLASLFYDLNRRIWQFGAPFNGHHLAPLPLPDIERFVLGAAALRASQAVSSSHPPLWVAPMCPNISARGPCQRLLYWDAVTKHMLQTRDLMSQPIEDLERIKEMVAIERVTDVACPSCRLSISVHILALQQKTWQSLSATFGLS